MIRSDRFSFGLTDFWALSNGMSDTFSKLSESLKKKKKKKTVYILSMINKVPENDFLTMINSSNLLKYLSIVISKISFLCIYRITICISKPYIT